jgi:hypothetical protein
MATTYGRQLLTPVVGYVLEVLADGDESGMKAGGVTIDWDTVDAVSGTDVTLTNGTIVAVGQKGLRYGQVMTKITATGAFGPYDVGASDGRQTLTRGECYVLNQTVLENGPLPGLISNVTNHPAVFDKGLVWYDRLIIGAAAHELGAAGPSIANFNTAFPAVRYVKN